MVTEPLAFRVYVPAVLALMVYVHCRVFASTTVSVPQVLLFTVRLAAELSVGVIEKLLGVVPAGIAVRVIVKVWGLPTSFTAVLGVIVILSSTALIGSSPHPLGHT